MHEDICKFLGFFVLITRLTKIQVKNRTVWEFLFGWNIIDKVAYVFSNNSLYKSSCHHTTTYKIKNYI